jgi:transcription antitermination factor NusG
MIGKMVRIIGGPMNGFTGHILSLRGARKRKVLVEIPNLIAAAVEVAPEYIEIINKTCPQQTER